MYIGTISEEERSYVDSKEIINNLVHEEKVLFIEMLISREMCKADLEP